MAVRAIIVDDEPLARKVIKEYLSDFPEIKVIGECSTGRQAVKTINEQQPDVVFLDVRMPGMDGFAVLEQLTHLPRIIFSTAHSDYALKAFEIHAFDYLLKPYDRARFSKAVRRLLSSNITPAERLDRLASVLQQVTGTHHPERIFVRHGRRIVAVPTNEILFIEADGDYSKLHTLKGTYLCAQSLQTLEERFDSQKFLRVHRSALIATNAVDHLQSDGEGGFLATLKNGKVVRVSRTYALKVKSLIW